MKKGYKRLLIFQIIMFSIIILNSFISNILSKYNMILFLAATLVAFKFILGFERDRNRHTKDILFDTVIFLTIYLILYYVFGIFIGFARTGNYYNWVGFKEFLFPITITIVFKEILRYNMVKKAEGQKWLIVFSCVLFWLLDISNAIYFESFKSSYNTFLFFALTVFPAVGTNIACTYISLQTGYKPTILYLVFMGLYKYLIPIIPNPSEYLASIILLIVPIVLMYRVYSYVKKVKDEDIERDYNKKEHWLILIPLAVIVITVYFTSGYFHYHAVAIATGSMDPTIKKGDVVIIEKLNEGQYNKLKKGQIVAFKYNEVLIVHRIIKVVNKGGVYYYYTQGDNNASPDGYPVTEEMMVGTVNFYIPFLGLPTIWLKEI